MNWFDMLISVPIVGTNFEDTLLSGQDWISSSKSFFKELRDDGHSLTISSEGLMSLQVESNKGFRFSFNNKSIVSYFNYPRILESKPGELEQMRYLVGNRKYSDICSELLGLHTDLLSKIDAYDLELNIHRVGFVCSALLNLEEPPPGVSDLIDSISSPWPNKAINIEQKILIPLSENEQEKKQCHHVINYRNVGDSKDNLDITLDWQISWPRGKRKPLNFVNRNIASYQKEAMGYFETVGQGFEK